MWFLYVFSSSNALLSECIGYKTFIKNGADIDSNYSFDYEILGFLN